MKGLDMLHAEFRQNYKPEQPEASETPCGFCVALGALVFWAALYAVTVVLFSL